MCLQESGWSKSCQLSSQIYPHLTTSDPLTQATETQTLYPSPWMLPPDSHSGSPVHDTIIFNIWLMWFHSPAQHHLMVSSHTQIQSKLLHMDWTAHKIWTLPSFQTFFLPPIPYFICSKHQLPHGCGISDIHFCGCGPRYFLFLGDYSSSHLLGILPHLIQVYNQTSPYQLCFSKATI